MLCRRREDVWGSSAAAAIVAASFSPSTRETFRNDDFRLVVADVAVVCGCGLLLLFCVKLFCLGLS